MTLKEAYAAFGERNNVPIVAIKTEEGYPEQLGFIIHAENGDWEGYAMCFEEEQLFVFFINLGVQIPKENRGRVLELFNSINYELKCGGFYMDTERGYIMARVTQYIYGTDEEKMAQVENCIEICGSIADVYYRNVMKIGFQDQ